MRSGDAGVGVAAIDEQWHQHLAAVFRETSRKLRIRWNAGREARQHFRRRVGVGNRHDAGCGRAIGIEQQTFGLHAIEHGPSHGVDFITGAGGDERRRGRGGIELQRSHRDTRIDSSDDLAKAVARTAVGFPKLAALHTSGGSGVFQVKVDAVHHFGCQIAIDGERRGAGQRRLRQGNAASANKSQPGTVYSNTDFGIGVPCLQQYSRDGKCSHLCLQRSNG